ncbi:hypothetical protein A2U01_0114602, partial [Trifolium medium]|nr:hypothetical protein [Trifolium medium]
RELGDGFFVSNIYYRVGAIGKQSSGGVAREAKGGGRRKEGPRAERDGVVTRIRR